MITTKEREINQDGYLILPIEFTSKGFTFIQVERHGDIAIYKKNHKNWPGTQWVYETVIIQKNPEYTIAGVTIPAKEAICSDSLWGTFGWSYNDLESAQIRMKKLIKK